MTYWVEYSGGMEVEADSPEEAIKIANEELLDLDMTAIEMEE